MSGTTAQVEWHPGAQSMCEAMQWTATTTPNNLSLFTTAGNAVIIAVVGTPETVETGVASVQLVRAAPGTTIANGTAICNAMNVGTGATAAQPQYLTQWGATENLTVPAGSRVGFTTSGTITASAGNITVYYRQI